MSKAKPNLKSATARPTRQRLWICLLALATLASYAPVVNNEFVWDDNEYIYDNPAVVGDLGLGSIWFSQVCPQYYPLVFTTFFIEHQVWQLNPLGYHIVNVLLHLGVVLLLLLVVERLGFGFAVAWIAAALFALHPVQVESVAWATQRKNVLSGLFYMLTILAYLNFSDTGSKRALGWCLVAYLCALLSKTTVVTLPVTLLLLEYLRGKRVNLGTLKRIAPLCVMAMVMALVTIRYEWTRTGAGGIYWEFSLLERCVIAGKAVFLYLGNIFYPANLCFCYERFSTEAANAISLAPLVLVIVVWAVTFTGRRFWGRLPFVAMTHFLIVLLPVLGFLDFYWMKYSFVADHFLYLPSIGVFLLIAAGGVRLFQSRRWPTTAGGVLAAVVLIVLAGLSFQHVGWFRDFKTLWIKTLELNPHSALAHNCLGKVYVEERDFESARHHYTEALAAAPSSYIGHLTMGHFLLNTQEPEAAIAHLEESLKYKPNYWVTHNYLGAALDEVGRSEEARREYLRSVEINPNYSEGWASLGKSYGVANRFAEAESALRHAIKLAPRNVLAHYDLGVVLWRTGRTQEAVQHFQTCLQIKPDYEDAAHTLRRLSQ